MSVRRIQAIGLHTRGTGGDNIRNLTMNPTAGIDPVELIDVQPLLLGSNLRDDNSAFFVDLTNPDLMSGGRIALETLKSSPADGVPPKPTTSTGADGMARLQAEAVAADQPGGGAAGARGRVRGRRTRPTSRRPGALRSARRRPTAASSA